MDNGLIFPYPRRSAHDEPGDANRPNSDDFLREAGGERVTRTGSSQAMG